MSRIFTKNTSSYSLFSKTTANLTIVGRQPETSLGTTVTITASINNNKYNITNIEE